MEWIEAMKPILWNQLQEVLHRNGKTIPDEFEPNFHLLCYMVCMMGIAKDLKEPSRDLLMDLASQIWVNLSKDTIMSPEQIKIKYLPKESFTVKNSSLKEFCDWVRRKIPACFLNMKTVAGFCLAVTILYVFASHDKNTD